MPVGLRKCEGLLRIEEGNNDHGTFRSLCVGEWILCMRVCVCVYMCVYAYVYVCACAFVRVTCAFCIHKRG